MNLDKIQLSASLTEAWYEENLVETGNQTPRPITPSLSAPMLGNFERKILILVQEAEHAFLPDEDLNLLTGILTACKMSLADVGIVNLAVTQLESIEPLRHNFAPAAWWLFGIDTPAYGLPLMNDPGRSYSHQNDPIFWAPSLQQLTIDPTAKRALWSQLKTHYSI